MGGGQRRKDHAEKSKTPGVIDKGWIAARKGSMER